jgi:hypothetical protein
VHGQKLLLDGHRRLADAQARFAASTNGRFPEHLVSVVSDRTEISEPSASLMNTAHQDWMTLENLQTEMPLTDDFAYKPSATQMGGYSRGCGSYQDNDGGTLCRIPDQGHGCRTCCPGCEGAFTTDCGHDGCGVMYWP